MAKNPTLRKEKVKEIFENMEYEKEVQGGLNLALTWINLNKNIFHSLTEVSKVPITIHSTVTEKPGITIEVNKVNNEEFSKLMPLCQSSLAEWNNLSGMDKAKLFNKLPAEIEKQSLLITELEMLMRDIFPKDTKKLSIPALVEYFQYYSGWASIASKMLEYKSFGVCVSSLSGKSPLAFLSMILAPCLATGNVIVLSVEKELIPICFLIKQIFNNAGFPPGIIQIINGSIKNILKHKDIGKLTYVGDLFDAKFTNLEIRETLNVSSLHLGKGSMLVYDTADLDSASDSIIDIAMRYRGYYPWSVNKLFVQESVYEKFKTKLENKFKNISVVDVSSNKNGDVLKTSLMEIKFGYTTAGSNILLNNKDNYLNVLPFRTASESVALANNGRLGLAASIWTENINLAHEVASKLKMSTVWINSHGQMNASCTFSPYKKSGKGYFGGREGFFEYLKYSIPNEPDIVKAVKEINIKQAYFYYGGGFKKPESGIDFSKKDVRNCVETVSKAQTGWAKQGSASRGQHLRKFADSCSAIQSHPATVKGLVQSLYEWATVSSSMMSFNLGSSTLSSFKESYGVIVIELLISENDCPSLADLKFIVGALSCGNAVIILNKTKAEGFWKEICSRCTLPAGVLNVINSDNSDVHDSLVMHQEIHGYFTTPQINKCKTACQHIMHDMVNIKDNSNESVINAVTKTKNIWNSIEESFL